MSCVTELLLFVSPNCLNASQCVREQRRYRQFATYIHQFSQGPKARSLKGLCHEIKIYLKAYYKFIINRYNFLFLSWGKNQTKSLNLLLWNLLTLNILPVTRVKDSKAAILTLKMLTESRLLFCKLPEAACDKSILAYFPAPMREHRQIMEIS